MDHNINVYEMLRKQIPRRVNIMSKLTQANVENVPVEGLTVHPAAEVFTEMTEADFKVFLEDVKKNEIQQPIVINADKQVLDGRHRLKACRELGIETVPARLFEGEEDQVTDYVISANVARRHLGATARAIVAVRLQHASSGDEMSEAKAAHLLNVSPRSVARVKVVERVGCNGLKKLLSTEAIKLGTAIEIARLSPEEQDRVVLLSPKEIREEASRLRGEAHKKKDSELDKEKMEQKYTGRVEKLVASAKALPDEFRRTLLIRLSDEEGAEELDHSVPKIAADAAEPEAQQSPKAQVASSSGAGARNLRSEI